MLVEDYAALAAMFESGQAAEMGALADEHRPVADGWMSFGGPGSFVNKACGLGLSGPVSPAAVEELAAFFTSRGAEPTVEVCPFVHPSLLQALGKHSFHLREFENVLFRRLEAGETFRSALPHGWPAGLELERIDPADARAVETYVDVSTSGFFSDGAVMSETIRATALKAPRLPQHDSFLARLNGRVVGAGGCASRAGFTALFGTSVLPAFRRLGVQQALIAGRLERALALGSALAIIVSHPRVSTERNASRLGFRMAFVRAILVRPGEGLAPSP